jgi:serine/threonine protein kinase
MSDLPPAPAEYTQRLLFPIVELSRGENGYVTLSFNPKQGGQPHDLPAMLIVKEMVFQGFIPKGFQQQLGTLLAQSQNLIRVHEWSLLRDPVERLSDQKSGGSNSGPGGGGQSKTSSPDRSSPKSRSSSSPNLRIVMDVCEYGSIRRIATAIDTAARVKLAADPSASLDFFKQRKVLLCRAAGFQLFVGLDYLHNKENISHTDMKPNNLYVDLAGRLRIGDFDSVYTQGKTSSNNGSVASDGQGVHQQRGKENPPFPSPSMPNRYAPGMDLPTFTGSVFFRAPEAHGNSRAPSSPPQSAPPQVAPFSVLSVDATEVGGPAGNTAAPAQVAEPTTPLANAPFKSDSWSAALTLLALFDEAQLKEKLQAWGEPTEADIATFVKDVVEPVDSMFADLLCALTRADAEKRISPGEALRHPFFEPAFPEGFHGSKETILPQTRTKLKAQSKFAELAVCTEHTEEAFPCIPTLHRWWRALAKEHTTFKDFSPIKSKVLMDFEQVMNEYIYYVEYPYVFALRALIQELKLTTLFEDNASSIRSFFRFPMSVARLLQPAP